MSQKELEAKQQAQAAADFERRAAQTAALKPKPIAVAVSKAFAPMRRQ